MLLIFIKFMIFLYFFMYDTITMYGEYILGVVIVLLLVILAANRYGKLTMRESLIAGAVVVLGGGAAAYFMGGESDPSGLVFGQRLALEPAGTRRLGELGEPGDPANPDVD